ncbi:MAG: putative glycosyltransferase [Gemmatimonadetes bacterium]|jgi:glycosyltransferase involved in cell wall biosynthesis|nr:putative glycosyltransferase [Gemmatimonadota bacterium]
MRSRAAWAASDGHRAGVRGARIVKLLVVNWQCRDNPLAGGAEIHLHEIFGRLASRGHSVTLLCSGWAGAEPRTSLDGIEVHRVGTRYTFPFLARGYFRSALAGRELDLLVEDVNKVPLFTPRWGGPPVVALVPHLFGGTAFQELAAPLAAMVWAAERPLGRVYRGVPFEAISVSTAADLAERGIPRTAVEVIYPGIDTVGYTPRAGTRARAPVFAYLGRLKKYKGVHHVIEAFAALADPAATLEIAGAGDYRPVLEKLAATLDLGERVRFLGRINEQEKLSLLRRAWALVFASPKEGWGITNLEAAACGTPVVASNSPGIRESVRDGETGYLVPHGDVRAMAAAMARLAGDAALVDRLGVQARRFAETFTWERAAEETERHLQRVITSRGAA